MPTSSQYRDSFFIVGIGASAGGVQALEAFFNNLPDDPNGAFVVVQHLSPNYRSVMTEILQRQTALPVQDVEDEMPLEPGKVYVLPPRRIVTLEDQRLRLKVPEGSVRNTINLFFQSLVDSWGEHTIAILLSGTGKDGTEGLQAVSRAGGIALVQSPETAQFTSMPSSAIPSGLVDEILSPQDLAQTVYELIRFSDNFPTSRLQDVNLIDPDQLQQILDILADREEIDFSHYKVSTLSRRIHHRCALTREANIKDYIQRLQDSEEEQKLLRQDLLIGATCFFRDAEVWDIIKTEVLPQHINSLKPEQPLRIWVSACATGEEAYSMAMVVDEVIQQIDRSIPTKIFATDLDINALEVAAQGVYPESIVNDVSPERLERYFDYRGNHYRVKRSLREMLIIAPHDLTKNAGFSRMHIVTCRNVMIYMQPQLQQQVIRLLHFALAHKGTLFLGSSETLGNAAEEFTPINTMWKLFQKRRDASTPAISMTQKSVLAPLQNSSRSKTRQQQLDRMLTGLFELCLVDRQVTCLLVGTDGQLLRIFHNTARLLDHPIGAMSTNVVELVHPALRLPLSTALHRAKRDQQMVLYTGIKVNREGEELSIIMRVRLDESPVTSHLMVFFEVEEPIEPAPAALRFEVEEEAAQQITELEYELQQTRENLQVTIEELETANEEQQATNEELLASNEELQSTNEELQSVNEELYTVNAEYQSKIQELTQLNNDIDNLLRSTDIGVVFLDEQLNIRKFTPAATRTINIKPADIGRPLTDLTNSLSLPNLVDVLQRVVQTEESYEQEIEIEATGDYVLMRVHPYLQGEQSSGIVLTFVQINELRQVQDQLQQANRILENLYQASPVGLSLFDADLKFIRINPALATIDGASVEEHLGQTFQQFVPGLADQIEPILRQVIDTGEPVFNVEIRGTTPATPNIERHWITSYYPVVLTNNKRGVGSVIAEVTAQKQTEQELRRRNEALEEAIAIAQTADSASQAKSEFLANMSHEIRMPMNSILMASRLLQQTTLEVQQQQILQTLRVNGERLMTLIDNVLSLSKIEAQELRLENSAFDILGMLENLMDSFRPEAEAKALTLTLAVAPELPTTVVGDEFRLQQVLGNLISNAIKFTPFGEVNVSVTRDPELSSDDDSTIGVYFGVKDSGIGIDSADKDKLFQPFIQADSSITRQFGGTGLGLTICRRIVQTMGGNIGLDSTPGEGTVAWFNAPFGLADAFSGGESVQGIGQLQAQPTPANTPRILLVEDYKDNRDLMLLMLESLGYEADWTANGQEFLDRMAEQDYDIVFLDCQMPLLDGYEAARRLRQREGDQKHTSIIGLTAHAMEGDREKCLEAGMDDYLSKPIIIENLIDLLQQYGS